MDGLLYNAGWDLFYIITHPFVTMLLGIMIGMLIMVKKDDDD